MAWTVITYLYDNSWTILDPDNFTSIDDWDILIDEVRTSLEIVQGLMSRTVGDWTRGVGTPKTLVGADEDAFYTSHIEDLRDEINYMEGDYARDASLWTIDPIVYKYNSVGTLVDPDGSDPREATFIEELQAATDLVRALTLSATSDDGGG